MRTRRTFILPLLFTTLLLPARRLEAQNPIATSLSVTASPSTVYPGQPVSVTVTITVAGGSVSDLNGQAIEVEQTPEASNGFSLGYLNNGVATAAYYPMVTGTSGGTVTLTASLGGLQNYQGSSASMNVTVLPVSSTTLQAGQYVFLLQDGLGGYGAAAVGSLALDGNGNVSGEEDLNRNGVVAPGLKVTGSYAFNQNGVGTLNLLRSDSIKQQFTVFLPSPLFPTTPTTGTLIETDGSALGTGVVTLQPSGYVQYFAGGTYSLDVRGTTRSISDAHDHGLTLVSGQLILSSTTDNTAVGGKVSESIGTTVLPSLALSGHFGAADAQGRFLFTATAGPGYSDQPMQFVGYAIDSDDIVLMSLDSDASTILLSGTGRGND